MATYALTIGGVSQSIRAGTLRITETINGRNTMSFEVISWNGSYRPAMNAPVIYTEDSTRLFGGRVDVPAERGFYPQGMTALVNHVSAVDNNSLVDQRYVNGIIPAGTLKAALIVLAAYLAPYGVTLDPAQVTGPALPLQYIPMVQLGKVLNDISVLSDYAWEIDYDDLFRMFAPGTSSASFNVVPASDPTVVLGDITVESVQTEYANRIIVLAGNGIRETTDTFTGDGSNRVFALTVSMTGYPAVAVNGTSFPVGIHGVDTHLEWTFRASDNAIVQLADAPTGTAHSALTGGDTLTVVYPGQYPFQKQADDAGEQASQGLWEKVIEARDVFDFDAAQALADSYLPRYVNSSLKRVTYVTRLRPRPGQTQTITVADRGLSGTFLITDVETTDSPDHGFVRVVKAIGGTTVPVSWRDFYQQLGSGRSGPSSSGTVIASPTTTTVLSSPYPLGQTRTTGQAPNPAAWLPVVNYGLYTAPSSFGARVRAWAWAPRNGAVNVTVRLYDVTASSVVAVGGSVTGTTPQPVTPFLVGLTAGHDYRLEVISGTNGEEVRAVGNLESV